MNNRGKTKILLIFLILLLLLTSCSGEKPLGEPVNIGLIAPLTGSLASSGEAIQRGILLAMDEINEKGGVLGRPVQLVVRDVQNNPEKGIEALRDLAEKESITAVFGGIFSPVMIAQLDTLKELEIPLINPWGSMTAITKNGQNPNYAFRVSVSDEQADEFLVRYAIEILNVQRPGIIVDTSGWGEANLAGLLQWAWPNRS
jgi:branched-chain amino acid transport system substrate-binding protein